MRSVYIGYDPRQPLSFNVMRHSVERHASKPVPITALILKQLPIGRQGATEFTFSRFLAPYLSGYEGWSAFFDEDQVCVGDVHELFECCEQDGKHSVYVMQNQPRFEWPSVMLFNNERCKTLTPEYIDDTSNVLYDFAWAESVGGFPAEWNFCVGYMNSNVRLAGAPEPKLFHYTQGIPHWPECRGFPEDQHWFDEHEAMVKSVDWIDLHRNTKHYLPVIQRMLKRYGLNIEMKATA